MPNRTTARYQRQLHITGLQSQRFLTILIPLFSIERIVAIAVAVFTFIVFVLTRIL